MPRAYAELPAYEGGLAAYASALLNWHRSHGYCGRCGSPTESDWAGFVRRCVSCDAAHHPRTDPVVIMLVVKGNRVLLGRQPQWSPGRYAVLSGFVEPGETPEEAVAREVLEETGVSVGDARYVAAQPWPFPMSLMLAFVASWEAGEPMPGPELETARWFSREELLADDGRPKLPPRVAIGRQLIDGWLSGALHA